MVYTLVKDPLVVPTGVHTGARHTLVKQAHSGVPTLVCKAQSITQVYKQLASPQSFFPPLSPNCFTEEGPDGVT